MIFISYSRKNLDLLEEFRIHLRGLFDEENLIFWTDNEVKPDQKWDREIQNALKNCNIAVMLISPTFLASEYIRDVEIPILLDRRESGQIKLAVLYLITSVVDQKDAAFKINLHGRERSIKLTDYQGLNTPDPPIAKFTNDNERAEQFKNAAIKLKELWDSIQHPSFRAQKSGRKQLTVTLETDSKSLHQCFYDQDKQIRECSLPWRDRMTVFEKWIANSRWSSMPNDFGDKLFDALFGGLNDQSCRELLAKVWELDTANSNPIRHPLRLKIHAADPLLVQLPWHRTTWHGQPLVQREDGIECGWSFEVIRCHPSDGFGNPDVRIKTPLPVQMILPDSGSSRPYAANHYESLVGCFGRIWSDRLFNKPFKCLKWREATSHKPVSPESIIYFYGSASWQDKRLILDFPDARIDLAEFKESLGGHSPSKIVFLNLCREGLGPAVESIREFSEGIDLVIVQTFQPNEHLDAERAAIDWFDEVLRKAADPVEAINRTGIDTATAWCNYGLWIPDIHQDRQPVRKELAKLLLNRHRQRETISKVSLDSLRSLETRVIATVACGDSSDRLHWFYQQIWTTLREDLRSHAAVHQTELRLREDASSLEDIRESLLRALEASPFRKLGNLLESQLGKARRDQSMLWILHWEPQGASLGRDFGANLFKLWEQFCREILARECPERLRILCLLPLETNQPQNVKRLVDQRPRVFDNRAYRFFELDPLDRVGRDDLGAFLQRPDINCPDELLNALPGLIWQHTGGRFGETVSLLEEGLSRTWGILHDRLAESVPDSQAEPPADPNQELVI